MLFALLECTVRAGLGSGLFVLHPRRSSWDSAGLWKVSTAHANIWTYNFHEYIYIYIYIYRIHKPHQTAMSCNQRKQISSEGPKPKARFKSTKLLLTLRSNPHTTALTFPKVHRGRSGSGPESGAEHGILGPRFRAGREPVRPGHAVCIRTTISY